MKNLANIRLEAKKSNFVLEIKIAELNKIKNSRQPDLSDTV